MSKDNSKGGYIRPARERKNVNTLLIGSNAADADFIKKELGIITGIGYTTWYCSDLEDALDFIHARHTPIDIIFLDLSLFNASYPKERFVQIRQNIPDIPIIVLTDRTDYDLQHFVMEEGAADNISQWQIRSDPDRLRNIVDSCRLRGQIARRTRDKSALDILDAQDKGCLDLQAAHDRSDAVLRQSNEKHTAEIKTMVEENAMLQKDKHRGEILLQETCERGASDLKLAHDWSDADMNQAREKYDAELLTAKNSIAQLQRDNARGARDLKEQVDQSLADLRQANETGDAILKYAQEKAGIDLKRVNDELEELHKDHEFARDLLSGSYSSS